MPLKDFTTKKQPAETIAEITALLTPHGVSAILSEYDDTGNIMSMSFKMRINNEDFGYKLPTDWRPVLEYFKRDKKNEKQL